MTTTSEQRFRERLVRRSSGTFQRRPSFGRRPSFSRRLSRQFSNSPLLSGAAELGRVMSISLDDVTDRYELYADLSGDHYDELMMLYDIMIDLCTPLVCSEANGIELLMQRLGVAIESVEYNDPNLDKRQEQIFRGILRVYAHFYQHHYHQMVELNLASTLDMCFQRLLVFLSASKLADMDTLVQVKKLVVHIRQQFKE